MNAKHSIEVAGKLSNYPAGNVFGANCPGCGDLTVAKAQRGGTFKVTAKCRHFVAVRLDETVEIEFAARPVPLD